MDNTANGEKKNCLEGGQLKFVSDEKFQMEKLYWSQPVHDGDKISYEPIEPGDVPFHDDRKIVDADGVVYDAILQEDGTVFDDWTTYDDVDTFERLRACKRRCSL